MSSISKIIEKEISASPFLEESIAEDLINISSLARMLKPKVEEELGKEVKTGALVMAINRMEFEKFNSINSKIEEFMNSLGDIIIDITKQKETTKRLAEEASRLTAVMNTVLDGVLTIDRFGTIQSYNPAAERILLCYYELVAGYADES